MACGVNYLLIGVLAVQIGVGAGGEAADTSGAMRAVIAYPGGLVLLWLVAVGFAGLALWRLAEVVYGQASPNGQTVTKRLASLGRAVMYIALCIGIVTFLLGVGSQRSGNKQSKDFTAILMSFTGGRWLVLLVGLGVVGVGLSMMVEAVRRKFVDNLHMTQMSARTRKTVQALGIVGIFARGSVFAVLGVFLVVTAATFDAKEAQGLDGALRKFTLTPLGPWLLVAVALGLVTFGCYSWFEARWRKTEPG
ncbi:DUF1206 domain-containing protein [Nonomuraea aurantiaca]|uniref:DUF1206 domain-containing protein n=1 Tax=Nonomuraea aurantiaca TaxID=2878562 RepID=UPI0027DED0F8|nr:DUF1206 domain-containing protein [Nonomuraea aurantiaca]